MNTALLLFFKNNSFIDIPKADRFYWHPDFVFLRRYSPIKQRKENKDYQIDDK